MSEPIDRLRAVLAAATPGPWEADIEGDRNEQPQVYGPTRDLWVAILPHECLASRQVEQQANARAIAALGTLHPALLAVVEAARKVERHWPCACESGVAYHRSLGVALDALDAAIDEALPGEVEP